LFDSTPLPDEKNVMDMFCNLLQKKLVLKETNQTLLYFIIALSLKLRTKSN